MQSLENLETVLRHVFGWLAFTAATFWYCQFPMTAMVLAGLAGLVLIVLSALGWSKMWNALENGKIPW